jgi:hypothetical protein
MAWGSSAWGTVAWGGSSIPYTPPTPSTLVIIGAADFVLHSQSTQIIAADFTLHSVMVDVIAVDFVLPIIIESYEMVRGDFALLSVVEADQESLVIDIHQSELPIFGTYL